MNTNNKNIIVVVDADAIIAQTHPYDLNHDKAVKIVEKLDNLGARALYPVTAITEAVTVLQRKLNSPKTAYGVAKTFSNQAKKLLKLITRFTPVL